MPKVAYFLGTLPAEYAWICFFIEFFLWTNSSLSIRRCSRSGSVMQTFFFQLVSSMGISFPCFHHELLDVCKASRNKQICTPNNLKVLPNALSITICTYAENWFIMIKSKRSFHWEPTKRSIQKQIGIFEVICIFKKIQICGGYHRIAFNLFSVTHNLAVKKI